LQEIWDNQRKNGSQQLLLLQRKPRFPARKMF